MKKLKFITNIFLISAAAQAAFATDIDVIAPTIHAPTTTIVSPSLNTSGDVTIIAPTTKVSIPYVVYVSAVVDKNITTSTSGGKEIFKMLENEHKSDVASFITPEIVNSPHVTLFQGEVGLTGDVVDASEELKKSLKNILKSYKNTTITVKDSEVGGMHAGGDNSYFIAYNVNNSTSPLRTMATLVKDEIGVSPKTYGDYATSMKSNGFDGVFTKHLSTTDESMLHISVLRAFTTKKVHPKYGDTLSKLAGVVDLYKSLRNGVSAVFDKPTEEQRSDIIKYALENYDGTTELFGSGSTAPLAGLTYKNTHMTSKVLETKVKASFTNIYEKKGLNTLDKDKLAVLLEDIMKKPTKFFKNGNVNDPIIADLPAKLLKAKGVYAVDSTGAPGENKKADDLCLALQKTTIGDLNLNIIDFQIDVSPKKPD